MKNNFVTRYAPSPTGTWHIGQLRTALFTYLYAKKNGGKFILRIDDTDKERSKPEHEEAILRNLAWLGLEHDELVHQSKRQSIHREYLEKLLNNNQAYLSAEKVEKEGDRAEVIRFRNPNLKITFDDLIRGEITFDTTELGDFIIAKDLDTPLYHLASVVDDVKMGITHIIRGEDHISNTPRQILLIEAIGGERPKFAHLPLVLAPDKTKLSKRKGAKAVDEYRQAGYLPEALVNFTALIGWSAQSQTSGATDQEIFSLAELIERFDLGAVQKSGAILNPDKLDWINREHLRRMPLDKLAAEIERRLPSDLLAQPTYNEDKLRKLIPIIIERVYTLEGVGELVENEELQFFFTKPSYNKDLLKTPDHLPKVIELLAGVSEDEFQPDKIKTAVWDFASEQGRANVLWPFRVALSGKEKSPDPFTIAAIIGKSETLSRLNDAIN
jgi:glutamyl-tRNA synthetase